MLYLQMRSSIGLSGVYWENSRYKIISAARRPMDGLVWALMKGVASCDKPRRGASNLRTEDSLMGCPALFGALRIGGETWGIEAS